MAVAQPFWPGCTRLVLLIDRREFPQGVGESHSVVISHDVQQGPLVSPLLLVSVGVKGETVQLLVPFCKSDSKARQQQETHHHPGNRSALILAWNTTITWLGEALQGEKNILTVLLLSYDQMETLKVLAVQDQRESWGRGRLFLYKRDQTVQNLVGGKYCAFIAFLLKCDHKSCRKTSSFKAKTSECVLFAIPVFSFWPLLGYLPMFHCALQPPPLQIWCVWLSGTACPPCSSWGTLGRAAWLFQPEGGKRKSDMKGPPLHRSGDPRCAHVISALINTPCSRTWPQEDPGWLRGWRDPYPWSKPKFLFKHISYISAHYEVTPQECGRASGDRVIKSPLSEPRLPLELGCAPSADRRTALFGFQTLSQYNCRKDMCPVIL